MSLWRRPLRCALSAVHGAPAITPRSGDLSSSVAQRASSLSVTSLSSRVPMPPKSLGVRFSSASRW